jgi:YidC/Oxa1 family membrane protein insertase
MIGNLFNTILTQPLFNILVFFYNSVALGDFGLAIILLTILIRLILWPLSQKSIRAQKDLQEIQPKIKEIQNKHKDNKEEQTKALLELYKTHKVNPFGGCLPILIQLPILIALYSVFLNGLKPEYLTNLYSIISSPGAIDSIFIGLIDLSVRSIPLAVLAGILQFFQAKMILPKIKSSKKGGDMAQMISKQTLYFLPVITVVISFNLPAGLPLYWATTTLFTIIQQFVIMKAKHGKRAGNKELSQ